MKTRRLIVSLAIAALAGGLIWKSLPARTTPIEGPNPIAALIPAEIGGMTQWLLIRGADRAAPILLWLHGGPGAAQMPIHATTSALERDFVVVHWDQRGAGKSNPPDFDPATMTLEQFLADAREVTALLRERVGDQPLIVLGHSWGTMLGARLVARWPTDYAGYIGVGQQVDTLRGAALALDWLGKVAPDPILSPGTRGLPRARPLRASDAGGRGGGRGHERLARLHAAARACRAGIPSARLRALD